MMGMIECRKHGKGSILFGCPEVAQAVWDEAPCPGIEELAYHFGDAPSMVLAGWFCPACVARHRLPPSGPVPDPKGFPETHNALYRPMCPGCFEEWRSSGGSASA